MFRMYTTSKPYITRDMSYPSWYVHALTAEESWVQYPLQALFSGAFSGASGAFSALQVHMTCIEHNHKQQQKKLGTFLALFLALLALFLALLGLFLALFQHYKCT